MPNKVKYNKTGAEPNSLFKGNWAIDVSANGLGGGPSSITGLYNGAEVPVGGYLIYSPEGVYATAIESDLLAKIKDLGGDYTSVSAALVWAANESSVIIVDKEYENIVTGGLVLNLDSGFSGSYPKTGDILYDLSGNNNNGYISSGEFNDGYLRNLNNVSNFFTVYVYDSASINSTFSTSNGAWTIEEMIWTNSTNYPEADGGSVASDSAYSSGQTGFDWNHGQGSLSSLQFGMSSESTGTYEDRVFISTGSINSINTWRHRTMVWNRGSNYVKLYMNGGYTGITNTPNTAGTSIYDGNGILFGSLYGWKHYGRRGFIRIYNRELTESEVLQNFNAQRTRFGI